MIDTSSTVRSAPASATPPARQMVLIGLRRCGRRAHGHRARVADVAYGFFVLVVVLLAFLPTGVSTTRQTISAYALSPERDLLRLAFCCLAVGSALAAYEFWQLIPGAWGRALGLLTGVWVVGDVVDAVVEVNPIGGHTVHGAVHQVVAVVAFTAVAGTVLVFLGWLRGCGRRPGRLPLLAVAASIAALTAVGFELVVTAASAVSMAGTAERMFFACALLWMIVARLAVAGWSRQPN